MRHRTGLVVALSLLACTSRDPMPPSHLAPPNLTVKATTRVISAASGAPALEVSALLRNQTTVGFQVAVGAQCPLYVELRSDPTGQYADSTSLSMACAPGGPALVLAPGDTAVLTRVLGADTLASFAPGRYGVNVEVSFDTGTGPVGGWGVEGVWADSVQLPLASSP